MIIKIFKRFYSITYLKNKPIKNIFIGYQNKDILKKIFKDSIFFDPTILTPFNFKILVHSVWIFFSNLFTEPKKLNFPISQFIFIYFLLAYIKVNKVRKITFLNHYDKIINSILPFLKDTKVYLLEHSLNLTSFRNSKATIFTNCFSLRNEKKEDSKVIELGSLKILYYLEKFNCWNICNEEYQRPKKKEIFYISTLSGYFWNYLKFFKYNSYNDLSNVDHFLNSIDPLKVIKDNNDLLKMRFLDNLMLLGIIKKLENQGYKISVISRNNSNMNKEILSKEKEFYQNNFKNFNFYEFSEEKKYKFLFKERDNVYLTDYSYFGFEALSINNKCLFFSNYLKNYFLKFFNANFTITNGRYSKVIEQIYKLENMSINDMKKFKQNLSKHYHIPITSPVTYKRFLDYLT